MKKAKPNRNLKNLIGVRKQTTTTKTEVIR